MIGNHVAQCVLPNGERKDGTDLALFWMIFSPIPHDFLGHAQICFTPFCALCPTHNKAGPEGRSFGPSNGNTQPECICIVLGNLDLAGQHQDSIVTRIVCSFEWAINRQVCMVSIAPALRIRRFMIRW